MEKAQSRLKIKLDKQQIGIKSFWKKYFVHLPTLLMGILFYSGVFLLVNNVYPQKIKDFLIPNLYLPLQLLLFLGNFFFLSYLWLNSRRGLLISLLINCWLFFKLLKVSNYQFILIIFFLLVIFTEGLIFILKKK